MPRIDGMGMKWVETEPGIYELTAGFPGLNGGRRVKIAELHSLSQNRYTWWMMNPLTFQLPEIREQIHPTNVLANGSLWAAECRVEEDFHERLKEAKTILGIMIADVEHEWHWHRRV